MSASSSNLPSTASGTLTKVSGTGDASITYSAYVTIGSNATENAIYTKSGNFFTVRSSITNTTILDTSASSGTIPSGIGVLTLLSGVGDATIAYSAVSQINGNMQFTTQQLAANLPSAPTIVAGTESPINCDASNPYQIGGFVFRLDGLTAYIS